LLSNRITKKRLNSYLSDLLNSIDLTLIEDDLSDYWTAKFFDHQKTIANLLINQLIFLENWQKVFNQYQINNFKKTEIFTGLIVASERTILQIIHQTIDSKFSLDLTNHLIVIHVPSPGKAILQGIFPLNLASNIQLDSTNCYS
jgi:hypothetical protein